MDSKIYLGLWLAHNEPICGAKQRRDVLIWLAEQSAQIKAKVFANLFGLHSYYIFVFILHARISTHSYAGEHIALVSVRGVCRASLLHKMCNRTKFTCVYYDINAFVKRFACVQYGVDMLFFVKKVTVI